mmetsp:Transcript_70794/g.156182  ORF Transcript_70794/g.156182 Transcript_70794/m.156182 type:complete len:243 (-) Transcript_70794:24-752(-)
MAQSDVVCLNVGGECYWTLRKTLEQYTSSVLAKMLSGEFPSSWDQNSRLCIDRDGRLFRHVLNYLRDERLPLGLSRADRTLLLQEAKYYGLDELHESLGGLQEPLPRPAPKAFTGFVPRPQTQELVHEMKTSRQYVRLRLGHEYSGGWLVSSPRNLPGVEYELHAACLARSPLEALNKLSKAGFLPCSQPPKMPRMSDADWELMLYKDHPVPLTVTPSQRSSSRREPNGTWRGVPKASSVRL